MQAEPETLQCDVDVRNAAQWCSLMFHCDDRTCNKLHVGLDPCAKQRDCFHHTQQRCHFSHADEKFIVRDPARFVPRNIVMLKKGLPLPYNARTKGGLPPQSVYFLGRIDLSTGVIDPRAADVKHEDLRADVVGGAGIVRGGVRYAEVPSTGVIDPRLIGGHVVDVEPECLQAVDGEHSGRQGSNGASGAEIVQGGAEIINVKADASSVASRSIAALSTAMHSPALHIRVQLPFAFTARLLQFEYERGIINAFSGASHGSFGRVILARKKRGLQTVPVAIKVIASTVTTREGFQDEAQMLLHLRMKADIVLELEARGAALSPADMGARHITYIYGVGEESDLKVINVDLPRGPHFLIVMEPLSETLADAFLEPALPPPVLRLLRAAHEIALGLAFMAQHGVVHSDLKPENIMLAADGCAVICDLGVGRLLAATTGAGHGGTARYIAPELVKNREAPATLASDIYAFGLVLWCMFSGRRDAWSERGGDIFSEARLLRGERPSMDALRDDTPVAVSRLIVRCWDENPAVRPTALAVARELKAVSWAVDPDSGRQMIRRIEDAEAALASCRADAAKRIEARDQLIAELELQLAEQIASHPTGSAVVGNSVRGNHKIVAPGRVYAAAERNDTDALTAALAEGLSTEETADDGMTALLAAAKCGHLEAFRLLVKTGANIGASTRGGATALHLAAQSGHANIVRLLVIHPQVDVNAVTMDGRTAVDRARQMAEEDAADVIEACARFRRS